MSLKLDPEALGTLIEAFLAINPHPSDQQFHALAEAIGVDKEQLEAVAYEMLGDELEATSVEALSTHFGQDDSLCARQNGVAELFEGSSDIDKSIGAATRIAAARRLRATTPTEDVLDGDYNEDELNSQELTLNDGQMEADNPNPGFQNEQTDDGADALDRGVGLEQDQNLLSMDGQLDPTIVED